MAEKSYYCKTCEKDFEFKSWYDRHLTRGNHKRLSAILQDTETYEELELTQNIAIVSPDLSVDHGVDYDEDDAAHMVEVDCNYSTEVENFMPLYHPDLDEDGCDDTLLSDLEELTELSVGTETDFTPFSSKIETLLFMLLHCPRPIGERNLKFILFMLRQSDPCTPSLDVLKRTSLPNFVTPIKSTVKGTDFFTILPSTILRQCLANSVISANISRYPVIPKSHIRELYHAKRWHMDFPAVMTVYNDIQIFVNDFVIFHHPDFSEIVSGKVLKVYQKEDEPLVYLEVDMLISIHQLWKIEPHVSVLHVEEDLMVIFKRDAIPVSAISEIVNPPQRINNIFNNRLIGLSYQEYFQYIRPHPLKISSGGLPVLTVPLILFSDDTSGNRSKKWNKFDYWSLALAGLSIQEARSFHNIYFLTCSNQLSALEIVGPMVEDLQVLEKGCVMYDAMLKREAMVVSQVMLVLSDNARASEILNHLGSRANKFCRICMAESSNPSAVGELRNKSLAIQQISQINEEEVESGKRKKRTEYGMKEMPNLLFNLSTDLYKSTPVEVLHTILLGVCKYMLRTFMSRRSKHEKTQLLAKLSAFSYCGFSEKVVGNIAYHYQSFIGRDFKAWMQLALFIIKEYLTDEEKKCWFSLAEVFRVVYCLPVNDDTIQTCEMVCMQFVDLSAEYMPEFSKRLKVHILLHLSENLKEFGPTHLYNTERFESYNSMLRNQNVFSNRHSPSKDIAMSFANLQHLRFICTSDPGFSDIRIGNGLKELYSCPEVQMFLNCLQPKEVYGRKPIYQPGCLRKMKEGKKAILFKNVTCHICYQPKQASSLESYIKEYNCNLNLLPHLSLDVPVYSYGAVIASNKDLVNSGDFVQLSHIQIKYGVLLTVFQAKQSLEGMCVIQKLNEMQNSDGTFILTEFKCPLLTLTPDIFIVSTSDIIKPVSIVHVCSNSCQMNNNSFVHDFTNIMFCYNVFCIGNYT